MDFTCIPEVEIDLFLDTNNILHGVNKYNQALTLLYSDNTIITSYMKRWLVAYNYQHDVIKINQPLSYYHMLFDDEVMTMDDVIGMLSHYHFHLTLLPDEVLFQLLLLTSNALKSVCQSLYKKYNRITRTAYFQTNVCQHVMTKQGYDCVDYDQTNTKHIYNTLQPASGQVLYCHNNTQIPMHFVDDIVTMRVFKHVTLFLSQSGQVYAKKHNDMDWQITDVCLPI